MNDNSFQSFKNNKDIYTLEKIDSNEDSIQLNVGIFI